MLLRVIAIAILILIALRLLGRLIASLFGPRQAPPPPRASSRRRLEPRQLDACPHCGTYFDAERTVTAAAAGQQTFCSSACQEAHVLEAGPVTGAGGTEGGDSHS